MVTGTAVAAAGAGHGGQATSAEAPMPDRELLSASLPAVRVALVPHEASVSVRMQVTWSPRADDSEVTILNDIQSAERADAMRPTGFHRTPPGSDVPHHVAKKGTWEQLNWVPGDPVYRRY